MIISACSPQATREKSFLPLTVNNWVSSASRKRDLETTPLKTQMATSKEADEDRLLVGSPSATCGIIVQPLVVEVSMISWEVDFNLQEGIQDSFREH